MYTGKEVNVVQKDLGKRAVMSWKEPFLDKGYYVFMDNYYTAVGGTRGKENFGLLVRSKPAQRHL